MLRIDNVADVSKIEARDPDTIVLEFKGRGEGLVTGDVYDQRYISVDHMRDGSIAHYEDYWNPIALLRAIKGNETTRQLMID